MGTQRDIKIHIKKVKDIIVLENLWTSNEIKSSI